jgi:hypothetical protein
MFYYGNQCKATIMATVKSVHRQCKTVNQCIAAAAAFNAARCTAMAMSNAYDDADWRMSEHFAHIADYAGDMRHAAHKAARRHL